MAEMSWPCNYGQMIAGHLAPLHSCCESLICLQGEGRRQDSLMEVIIRQREGKWGRGDVLNSPWTNSSVWCTDLLHCLCTPCTASRVHSSQWRMTTSPPDTLVWSVHLQADQTATDRVVTSLTWKQAGINTFGTAVRKIMQPLCKKNHTTWIFF